jgi:regulator of replication initiation timing
MYKKKSLEKNPLDDEVVFVSPEGIQSLETAIENLEHIYKEMKKAVKATVPANAQLKMEN